MKVWELQEELDKMESKGLVNADVIVTHKRVSGAAEREGKGDIDVHRIEPQQIGTFPRRVSVIVVGDFEDEEG